MGNEKGSWATASLTVFKHTSNGFQTLLPTSKSSREAAYVCKIRTTAYVRKIGEKEVRSVEQITELEPGSETLYSVQLGAGFVTREWVKESELEAITLTAEQQKQYTRLSGTLQGIGHRHHSELPNGAASLSLNGTDGRVVVEVYDHQGKKIATVPNDKTSAAFRSALQQFLRETLPDPDVIAIL